MEKYLSLLILDCLQKINSERTTYSIYHLLKGKKSSQTIQDAHLFHISNLFQTFPQLSRVYFDRIILELSNKQYIRHIDGERYELTQKGIDLLDKKLIQMPIPTSLNGWKFHPIQDDFWKRLSLLVQVCSNLINFEVSYIPIHNEVKLSDWLKITLLKLNKSREQLAAELLEELIICLNAEADMKIKQEAIIWRLTGYRRIGLTPLQAAELLNLDSDYFHLEFLNAIHYMIMEIMKNSTRYPILQSLISDFQKPFILTNSSAVTYRYLKNGHTIDEIAVVRNLKASTIEDHVVEIVLNDKEFSLESFVPPHTESKIRQKINELSTKQLKWIRQELKEEVTYFQIRLVLAKYGDQNES